MSLVVVDDDVEVRKAICRLLRAHGHQVRSFGSVEELDADPATADCLIVDVRLPGASGLELKERMRRAGLALPIVLITGDGEPSTEEGTPEGTVLSLAKPFDEAELMAAIDLAVRSPQGVQ